MTGSKNGKGGKAKSKRQMLVYLPEETITALKIAGVEERESVSSIIERLVDKWLQHRLARFERKNRAKNEPGDTHD